MRFEAKHKLVKKAVSGGGKTYKLVRLSRLFLSQKVHGKISSLKNYMCTISGIILSIFPIYCLKQINDILKHGLLADNLCLFRVRSVDPQ